MIEDIKSHFWHYAILVLVIFVGGIVFFSYPDKTVKFRVGTLTALAYIFWGIFHQLMEANLNLKIVVEYTLIGVLAIILLGGVLL
jgi:hypothetical protein